MRTFAAALALTLTLVLLVALLTACQALPFFATPTPTLTPTPTQTPTPAPTATPTPPVYLSLVTASALPPTSTTGAILFSTQAQTGATLLWQISSRGLFTVTDRLLDTAWDCSENRPGAPHCAFADQEGQIYTTTLAGSPAPLLIAPSLPVTRLDLAPNGLRLSLVLTDDLDILDLAEPAAAGGVSGLGGLAELRWAPDSQHLAVITRTADSANLYVLDLAQEPVLRQIAAGDWLGMAAWAPDSKRLAFAQRGLDHPNGGSQRQDLFVSDAAGAEVLNRTEYFEDRQRPAPDHAFGVRWLTWLADSSTIAFTWTGWPVDPQQVEVSVVAAAKDGGAPTAQLAAAGALLADGTRLAYSPDGAQVAALLRTADGRRSVWGRPLASDTWVALTPAEHAPLDLCWTSDSLALVYTTDEGSLYWLDSRGGLPVRLVAVAAPQRITRLQCP